MPGSQAGEGLVIFSLNKMTCILPVGSYGPDGGQFIDYAAGRRAVGINAGCVSQFKPESECEPVGVIVRQLPGESQLVAHRWNPDSSDAEPDLRVGLRRRVHGIVDGSSRVISEVGPEHAPVDTDRQRYVLNQRQAALSEYPVAEIVG